MQLTTKEIKISQSMLRFITLFLLAITFTIFISSQFTFADFEDFARTECATIVNGVASVANDVFSHNYYETISEEGGILATVIDALKAFGAGFAIVLGVIKTVTEIQKAQDPVDCILRCFFELCIAIVFIDNIDNIINVVDSVGQELLDVITGSYDNYSAPTADQLREQLGYKDSWWGWISFSVMLLIPYAFAWIEGIAARIVSYSIIIELGVRRAFIPFAIGDIGVEGLRSNGFRYLKKYLSVYVQQAVILITCIVLSALTTAVLTNGMTEVSTSGSAEELAISGSTIILNILGLNLAGVFIMFKATSWASDVVGG